MEKATNFAKKHWALISILILVSIFTAAKFSTFNLAYVNRDEPLYAWQSLAIYHNPELAFSAEVNYFYSSFMPLLASPLHLFFEPPSPVRIVVFLFSITALIFTYLIGKKIFSKRAGIAAMAFLMLSPCFFYYATKAMPDVPIVALGTAVIYLLLTLNRRKTLLLPPILIVMYLIKPASLIVLPPIAIFLLVKYRNKINKTQMALAGLAFILLVLGAFLLSPYTKWSSPWPPGSTVSQIWSPFLIANHFFWQTAGISLSIFALIGAIMLRKRTEAGTGLLLLWIFLTPLPFVMLRATIERYCLLAVPALAVIAGKGLEELAAKRKYAALGLSLIAIASLSVFSLGFSNNPYVWDYPNPEGFGAVYLDERLEEFEGWIASNAKNEDLFIILANEYMMRGIRMAGEKALPEPRKQMVVNPKKRSFEEIIKDNSRAYYLVVDDKSQDKEFWLFSQDLDWENYLKELGFKKIREFPQKGVFFTETYYIYCKAGRDG